MLFLLACCLMLSVQAEDHLSEGFGSDRCDDECCYYTSPYGVKVAECSYNELTQAPQNVHHETQILDLRGNEIKFIPKSYFDRFPELEKLYINYNELERIESGSFDSLSKLTFLDMHENNIKTIPAGLFKNNRKLETLKMHENKLESLPTGLFDGLYKLETLKLGGNEDELKCDCSLVAQTFLKCSDHSSNTCTFSSKADVITEIPATFKCPAECECYRQNGYFVASCNNRDLTEIPNDIPRNVQKLFLNHNKIEKIEEASLAHLQNLKELSLRGNKLSSIEPGMFRGLYRLQKLYLNYNEIKSIAANSFEDLMLLDYLDLHGNPLKDLDRFAFEGLQRLRTLDLHNCELEGLPDKVFDPLMGLMYMRLEGNQKLECSCPLIKKFMRMLRPGSYGKCTFQNQSKHIVHYGQQESPDPCVLNFFMNWLVN